ncbi:hypothetical protein NLM33_36265 [Bradyrhizobium sp. CCGUVB1N3]|uniref:hypothetical protein n=1 Tax=Bradyrhizobium sp. CCGUVB1N3 TaxID=2949629 RepID=UPI0020B24DF7|nr:hypothetical protein [Bradyrhizobium sp. CCGUVB1N3]MCP3475722.1 hypothetical protein [Bradyrhizobium sp. CCGUVB1N3]
MLQAVTLQHRQRPAASVLVGPFRDYLEKRWEEGDAARRQLLTEVKLCGFEGSEATVYR